MNGTPAPQLDNQTKPAQRQSITTTPRRELTVLDLRVAQHELLREQRRRTRKALALQGLRDRAGLPLRSAHMGPVVPQLARQHHDQLVQHMIRDVEQGATVHRRLPLVLRLLPLGVAALDALVLYLFCADVLNVEPGDNNVAEFAAVALAALGSGVTYAWLWLCGIRLRDYRNRLGAIEWRVIDGGTKIMVIVALFVTASMAALMYSRVESKALAAAASGYVSPDQVTLLAAVFGVFSACANLSVLAVHALDGSAHAVHARDIGRAVRAHYAGTVLRRRVVGRRVTQPSREPSITFIPDAVDGDPLSPTLDPGQIRAGSAPVSRTPSAPDDPEHGFI